MKPIKRIFKFIGITFGIIFTISITSVYLIENYLLEGLCENDILEIYNINNDYNAILFYRGCGATTDTSIQLVDSAIYIKAWPKIKRAWECLYCQPKSTLSRRDE